MPNDPTNIAGQYGYYYCLDYKPSENCGYIVTGLTNNSMNIFLIILTVIAAYFFLIFVVLRLVAPFMGFSGYRPPNDIPQEVRDKILELESKSRDQMSYLQAVYNSVLGRWQHSRFKAAILLPKLFKSDLSKIWHTEGFVYCTTINFAVYVLLANSKYFKAGDVKVRHVFLNFVPHQYLQVRVGESWVDVDPAGAGIRGFGLGHHASWFG